MADTKIKIVARTDVTSNQQVEITGCFDIRIGDKPWTGLTLIVKDGWLEIGTEDDILVQPWSRNMIRVKPARGLA